MPHVSKKEGNIIFGEFWKLYDKLIAEDVISVVKMFSKAAYPYTQLIRTSYIPSALGSAFGITVTTGIRFGEFLELIQDIQ